MKYRVRRCIFLYTPTWLAVNAVAGTAWATLITVVGAAAIGVLLGQL